MKHATEEARSRIKPLLGRLRRISALQERSAGVFYLRSKAFLHFHEHGEEVYADIKVGDEWRRVPATSEADWEKVLALTATNVTPK